MSKNTILEAINDADDELREEFLKPFGVKNFPALLKEFMRLKKFEQDAKDAAALKEKVAESVEVLTKAGIKVEGNDDPMVIAYTKLSEEEKPKFVARMGTKPVSSEKQSGAVKIDPKTGKPVLKESENKEYTSPASMFPHQISEAKK